MSGSLNKREPKIHILLQITVFFLLQILLNVESADGTLRVAFEPRLKTMAMEVMPTGQEPGHLTMLKMLQAKHASLVRLADSPFAKSFDQLLLNSFGVL